MDIERLENRIEKLEESIVFRCRLGFMIFALSYFFNTLFMVSILHHIDKLK